MNHISSSNKNSNQQAFSYAYDRYGNRWQQTATQGTGPQPQYTFNGNNNQIDAGSSGITYDVAGNMLTDGLGDTLTWDAEGRLIKAVNGSSTWTYVYDALGNRVQGPNGYYLYDLQGRAMAQINSSGGLAYGEIYAGSRHLATYSVGTGGTTSFIHADWLGTKRVVTGVNGASVQTCTNLPFGDQMVCSGTSTTFSQFTDDIHDPEINLEHTTFRQYSSTQGRWTGPDPAGMLVSDATNPQSWNRYAYVTGNPVNLLDPFGLEDCGGSMTLSESGAPPCFIDWGYYQFANAPYCGSFKGSSAGQCDDWLGLDLRPRSCTAMGVEHGDCSWADFMRELVGPGGDAGGSGLALGFRDKLLPKQPEQYSHSYIAFLGCEASEAIAQADEAPGETPGVQKKEKDQWPFR